MSDEILADLRAVANVLGVPVIDLTRDDYMQVDTKRFSRRKVRAVFGVWKNATRAAAGIEVEAAPMEAVPTGFHVRRVSTLKDPDGQVKQQWTISERDREDREATLRRLLEELPTTIPVREGSIPAPTQALSEDLLAVFVLGDPHIGLHASEAETGASWDLAKGVDIHRRAINALASEGAPTQKALLVNLGDFFHTSANGKTTVKGTSVDTSGRWYDVYEAGLALKIHMIDRLLLAHAEVEVWSRMGNHEGVTALMLAIALRQHYRNEPRVDIKVSPGAADYLQFGSVLIGATHGDTYKMGELESIMAADQAQAWGETHHRYWLVGHLHHRIVKEFRGCVVEVFRTLVNRDAYHDRAGYRSSRDMNRITIHRDFGEVARSTASAGYLMAG